MDEIATKAILIGASIFITLIIVTVVILEFSQIQKLYKVTGESDVSFESRLDEFDKYRDSNNIFTGLDVKNTISKYVSDKQVKIYFDNTEEITELNTVNKSNYNKKYTARLEAEGHIYKIIFKDK